MASYDNFQILIDEPSPNPSLGFDRYAEQFAQLIRSSRPQFSISILASWGSGKTTLMNAVRDDLTEHVGGPDVICVDFNAWRYEREPDLVIPLLDAMREALQQWIAQHPTGHETARSLVTTIGRVARAFARGLKVKTPVLDYDVGAAMQQLENDTEVGPSSLYFAAFRELKAAVPTFVNENSNGDHRTKRRIVVFIDDLDRCLPDRALELLEHMKLFFDIEGFVFVAGIDPNVIARAVAHHYDSTMGSNPARSATGDSSTTAAATAALTFGQDYLKKIFQVPFPLPPIDETYLHQYIGALASQEGMDDAQRADLLDRVSPHLRHFVDGSINPREIKLLVNAYTISLKLLSTRMFDPDPDIALAIQVLSSRRDWTDIYDELVDDPQSFPDELRGIAQRTDFPWTFVGYVEGRAKCLVDAADLEPYVAVVEATRSSDPTIAEALRTVKSLLRSATIFADILSDHTTDGGLDGLDEQLKQFTSITRAGLQEVAKTLTSPYGSRPPGGLYERVVTRVEDLDRLGWLSHSPSVSTLRRELPPFARKLREVEKALSDLRQVTGLGAAS